LNDQARESKRAADIARLRYREGVVDFLSLLDAERTQLQAEDAVAESEKDVYVAVIALYKALGGVPADPSPLATVLSFQDRAQPDVDWKAQSIPYCRTEKTIPPKSGNCSA